MKIVKAFCMAVLFVAVTAGTSSAFVCKKMELRFIGGNDFLASGAGFWAKNVTGGACNQLANGKVQQFALADTPNSDKKLAILLTAYSLGAPVYVAATGDGSAPGGLVSVVSMSK